MDRLLVITGPPGAGKSAVASTIGERLDKSVVVSGDSFFEFLASGRMEPWLHEAHEQNKTVLEAAASATARFVRDGYSTIYDGVVGPWFLPMFAEATGLESLDYAVLMPPLEVCLARALGRQDDGFANESAVRHMHRDFVNTDIEPRHIIDPVTSSPREIGELVLSARDSGALVYTRH